jgi:cell wall-associated NlpC family hydrolase
MVEILTKRDLGSNIAALAREWAAERVPYLHRGTTRSGCDCTGLILGIAREMGFLLDYKLREYPPDWNLHGGAGNQVIDELKKFADAVAPHEVVAGDIVLMRFGKCPAHCGIIVEPHIMVHNWRSGRYCRFAMLQNSMWSRRWISTYRFNVKRLANG